MANKVWYQIEVECIKSNASYSMEVGEKTVVAKVKSMGLACHVAYAMEKVYNPKHFNVTIK